jgi:hypothetical protein
MPLNWAPVMGRLRLEGQAVHYVPELATFQETQSPLVGLFICDATFAGGDISAEIQFQNISSYSLAEIVVHYEAGSKNVITAGLGRSALYSIGGLYDGGTWRSLATTGIRDNLTAGRKYKLRASFVGSRVALSVDDVLVLEANLPRAFVPNQVGLLFHDESEIIATNFRVTTHKPKAFVVMQFSSPFDELYGEVIKSVCTDFGLDVIRADEIYGPGLIISDVTRAIVDSKLIIAEITPANPNVYFEVGYAHAWNKPTILLARKDTPLPFDVSPFRVLFYEDSIAGKRRVEEGLRQHLTAIMQV